MSVHPDILAAARKRKAGKAVRVNYSPKGEYKVVLEFQGRLTRLTIEQAEALADDILMLTSELNVRSPRVKRVLSALGSKP